MMDADVVIVNDFAFVNGGAGQVALSSSVALAARGHRITVFTGVGPVAANLEDSNIHVICTNQHQIKDDPDRLRAISQGLWNAKAAREMDTLLADLDPSHCIIHVHSWTKCLSSSIIAKALSRGFKVVITMHDYFMACPNGGFYDYGRNRICELKPLSPACIVQRCDKNSYPQKVWRMGRQLIQQRRGHVPSGIKHFISISNFSHRILKPFLPEDGVVHNLPNPIMVDKNEPACPDSNDRFVMVGRLSPEKGVMLFAEAARKAGCVPVFVGDGECREEIVRLNPEAIITGWVDRGEVVKYLGSARALVLPSLWYETQGMVVLEAASLGIPSIVPDCCAACEMVDDNTTGLWFKSGDTDDLAQKITTLQDKARVRPMGQAAYERFWSAPPTMERHVEGLEQVYAQIRGDHKRSKIPNTAMRKRMSIQGS